ncbi:hypothetical protein KUCAC02_036583 [Chaenocephalus aceratus]|nr:hypothetical protein KUCAC02_036583 [Chaenocephalus aceratus]
MEDEDGTCLLDVLCSRRNRSLLCLLSVPAVTPQALNDFLYGTNELQTEDLLINSASGGVRSSQTPRAPALCLETAATPRTRPPPAEALLSSPEGEEDPEEELGGTTPVQKTGYEGKKGGVQCDILQQSLQEAQITEQTMALDPGGDNLSLYSPPFIPRGTQAAVDPPQPSLLAVGPGCPSLKPAAQLMGLLPGNSKLPVSIQPRLVQISPKQPGQKQKQNQAPSLTFKPVAPPQPPLPKQLSLQLVNPGSFCCSLTIFQGQNQYLLQGRAPRHYSSQHAASAAAGVLRRWPSYPHGAPRLHPSDPHVPPRQLKLQLHSPAGQLALRQVLSGPLQLQSGPRLSSRCRGAYAAGGPCSTLVHGPALGNHITLINSSGVLPPDLTSISITEGPLSRQQASVVLLPESAVQEERGPEETLQQSYRSCSR